MKKIVYLSLNEEIRFSRVFVKLIIWIIHCGQVFMVALDR